MTEGIQVYSLFHFTVCAGFFVSAASTNVLDVVVWLSEWLWKGLRKL